MSIQYPVRPGRRRLLALSLVIALGTLATGCDSTTEAIQEAVTSGPSVEDDPDAALKDAVAAIGEWEGIEAAFRLEADDEARAAALAEGEVTEEEAELLFGSSVILRASGLEDPDTTSLETSVVVDGTAVFDLRVNSDDRFFVRLDLETLSTLSDNPELTDVDDLVVAGGMFGFGDVAQAAADGRWIELLGIDDVRELAGAEPADEPEIDEADLEALNTRISRIFERFVDDDVAVSHVGSDDIGERVRMTTDGASLEALFTELTTEFDRAGLLDELAGDELDELDVDDDLTVSLDAWIDGGELRQVAVDVNTLDDVEEIPGELLIVVTMEEFTGTIAEPEDVEPFDILSLVGAFFGGFGDDPFGGGDPFGDGFGDLDDEDGSFGDLDDEDLFGDDDVETECITQQELDELAEVAGPEAAAEIESLVDLGFLEIC
jgi:hypothetical protein